MQVRNNYELGIFNGDIGRVCAIDIEARSMITSFDDREVVLESGDLDDVQRAYACSIHKAQGSEYPAVVIPVSTQHWIMLERSLLYTAVTRGKRLVVLVGNRAALERAVCTHRTRARHTRLAERIANPPNWPARSASRDENVLDRDLASGPNAWAGDSREKPKALQRAGTMLVTFRVGNTMHMPTNSIFRRPCTHTAISGRDS